MLAGHDLCSIYHYIKIYRKKNKKQKKHCVVKLTPRTSLEYSGNLVAASLIELILCTLHLIISVVLSSFFYSLICAYII